MDVTGHRSANDVQHYKEVSFEQRKVLAGVI